MPEQPRLQGAARADVCILGAGYTGLTAALALAEAGYSVIVLEARRIGWGASGRNGGQAIVGYGCEQETLKRWSAMPTRGCCSTSRATACTCCARASRVMPSPATGATVTPMCR